MVVEQQLATELKVQLVAEAPDALENCGGLLLEVLVIVKADGVCIGFSFDGVQATKTGALQPAKSF